MRHFVKPSCKPSPSASELCGFPRRPAHWINRRSRSTRGMIERLLRRAKVRACSSEIVVGGGVEGELIEVREEVDELFRLWEWAEGLT